MKVETAVNAALSRFGVQLQRMRPRRNAVQLFLMKAHESGANTVLDVGANVGQFGLDVRTRGWLGPIVSFEPLSAAHARLAEEAQRDGRGWIVPAPVALGSAPGKAAINVARNIDSSSFLQVGSRGLAAAPEAAFVATQTVEIRPLDELVHPSWLAPFALKIDTQGYELEVLKGAEKTLRRTAIILVEMSLTPLYEGGAAFAELYAWLEEAGFRCIALPETFADTVKEEVLQVDGVFVRYRA